jgi:peptidoglycan/xylan/chitin deacetylase (PgdA/CDA1 family)
MSPKLRRLLHVTVAKILYYSGALGLWRWCRRKLLRKDEVCVVGLHRILTRAEQERSNSLDGMIIRDVTYLGLLAYLQRRFQVVSLNDFLTDAEQRAGASKPQCIITFDDGWADTYSRAFPGLKQFGLPAVVFLATGAIGSCGGFWVEQVKRAWRTPSARLRMQSAMRDFSDKMAFTPTDLEAVVDWLKRMPTGRRTAILERMLPTDRDSHRQDEIDAMLTWDQAREMSDVGVEIGAHTVTHPLLSYEDDASVERELKLCKQTLEEKLGKEVRAFAYPNGDWNERIRDQVAEIGYRCAFTTRSAWHQRGEDPYTISRVLLHEGNITAQQGEFSAAMLHLTLAGWA